MGLVTKSTLGDVQWAVGESEREFVVNFPSYTVSVSKVEREDLGVRQVVFQVRDSRGYVVLDFDVHHYEEDYTTAAELFELAKRKALDVPGALETLKKELRKPGAIGSTGTGSV